MSIYAYKKSNTNIILKCKEEDIEIEMLQNIIGIFVQTVFLSAIIDGGREIGSPMKSRLG
jgi:hypothetical protein